MVKKLLLGFGSNYLNICCSLVPAQFRVLYVNLVTVVWDIFLSYIKHHQDDSTIGIAANEKELETRELFFR
jgi:hypothetical protein